MIESDHTYLKTSQTLDNTSMKTMQYTWNLARKQVKIPQNMQNAPDIFVNNFIRCKMYDPQNALDISPPLGVNSTVIRPAPAGLADGLLTYVQPPFGPTWAI